MQKKRLLLVFKDKKKITKNQNYWFDKLSKGYQVDTFYLYDHLNLTNSNIIKTINDKIDSSKIEILLVEGDHLALNDLLFFKPISKKVIKGLFLGDDPEWHQVNLITAASFDFVLTDAVSVLKFKEMGIESLYCPIEANEEIFKDYNLEKDIDVLFFGRKKPDTEKYLELLDKNNIKYLCVDPYMEISNTMVKLARLINKSKIVINFTKTLNGNKFFNPLSKYKYGFFAKGRPHMSGLCNTLCISEYAPSNDLLYPNGELPTFKNEEKFLDIIKLYLNDNKKLLSDTKIFKDSCLKYSDKEYIKVLANFMSKIKKKELTVKIKIPFWYYLIAIKQYFRLRSKFNKRKSFFMQFFENFSLPIYLIPINIFFFIRFLPSLIIKIIIPKKNV